MWTTKKLKVSNQIQTDSSSSDEEINIYSGTAYSNSSNNPAQPPSSLINSKVISNSNGEEIKKPKSAYLFFCVEERENVKNDGFESGEILVELGKRWTELTNSEKEKYVKMAEEDKQRYTNELNGIKVNKKEENAFNE
jgi:hypothetical protein